MIRKVCCAIGFAFRFLVTLLVQKCWTNGTAFTHGSESIVLGMCLENAALEHFLMLIRDFRTVYVTRGIGVSAIRTIAVSLCSLSDLDSKSDRSQGNDSRHTMARLDL